MTHLLSESYSCSKNKVKITYIKKVNNLPDDVAETFDRNCQALDFVDLTFESCSIYHKIHIMEMAQPLTSYILNRNL